MEVSGAIDGEMAENGELKIAANYPRFQCSRHIMEIGIDFSLDSPILFAMFGNSQWSLF
jgi:hypothetical protein